MTSIDETFMQDYIAAWTVEDSNTRTTLVEKLYAENAIFYANESNGPAIERHGLAEIDANITQVNDRLVKDKKLITVGTGFAVNHDTIRITWSMKTADGVTAMTGMNILQRRDDGKIVRDYIFIG